MAMTRNTIVRNVEETLESRYFISSLPFDVREIAWVTGGRWMVENLHCYLDVTFYEDDNHTLEKQAAYNLNIMRKLSLNVLKIYETGETSMGQKMKHFAIVTNHERHLESILNL